MPACNGRFGASGAVARLKVCVNLEVFAPVRALVEVPPASSRWDVICKPRSLADKDIQGKTCKAVRAGKIEVARHELGI